MALVLTIQLLENSAKDWNVTFIRSEELSSSQSDTGQLGA